MNVLGIEKLEIRRNRSLLNLMYTESKIPSNIEESRDYMILRRTKKAKMKSDFTKLTKIQCSPYYRGLKLWNSLPENVQKEESKSKFKFKLSKCIV